MQDRRTFLSRSLAFAATLPTVAAALADRVPDGVSNQVPDVATLPVATLDVRPLGNGFFLVSGWVLTAADLGALGHAA